MIEPSDKAILTAIYISSLEPEILPLEFLKNRTTISEDMFDLKIKYMIKNGFVENSDPLRLTFIGRGLLKVVLIGGVFDIVHPGHIHTLKDAKNQGDVLVVVVARSSTALDLLVCSLPLNGIDGGPEQAMAKMIGVAQASTANSRKPICLCLESDRWL